MVGMALGLVSGSEAQPAPALQPLTVIALPFEVAAAVYYAQDLHLFERAGLGVTIQSLAYGGAITAAVVSGAADIGSSNVISIEVAHQKGLPVTILGGAVYEDERTPSNGFLAVAAGSPIRTAKDLSGKTVAVSGVGEIGDLAVRNWIDRNGGDSSSVKFVEATFPTMTASLLAGRIDAASEDGSNFHAAGSQLRLLGNTFDSFGARWLQSVWFTSTDFAAKHPDAATKFIAAIRTGSAWANAHPQEAIRIFAQHSKYTVAQLEATPRPPFVTQPVTPAQVQTTIDVAAKYGMLAKGFPGTEVISPLNDTH